MDYGVHIRSGFYGIFMICLMWTAVVFVVVVVVIVVFVLNFIYIFY